MQRDAFRLGALLQALRVPEPAPARQQGRQQTKGYLVRLRARAASFRRSRRERDRVVDRDWNDVSRSAHRCPSHRIGATGATGAKVSHDIPQATSSAAASLSARLQSRVGLDLQGRSDDGDTSLSAAMSPSISTEVVPFHSFA
jgi:hypothetical protein